MSIYANLESFEDNVTQEITLNLAHSSRKLVITNDHASNDLKFRFNASENWATLKGTESLSLYHYTRTVLLDGNGPYRVWVFG